jgi:hypothetical protein
VTDNPYLLTTGYVATLQALPEPRRSQLLYGDFAVGTTADPWQVIPIAAGCCRSSTCGRWPTGGCASG